MNLPYGIRFPRGMTWLNLIVIILLLPIVVIRIVDGNALWAAIDIALVALNGWLVWRDIRPIGGPNEFK